MTQTQKNLLKKCLQYTGVSCPVRWDVLKSLTDCKSFNNTFNSLLMAGYFEHVETNDFSNQFKATTKAIEYNK